MGIDVMSIFLVEEFWTQFPRQAGQETDSFQSTLSPRGLQPTKEAAAFTATASRLITSLIFLFRFAFSIRTLRSDPLCKENRKEGDQHN
jgi:hypothetical protein